MATDSATVRVVFLTMSLAPSLLKTVRFSMLAIGSAAARTISGRAVRMVWMMAASLNCL